MKENIEKKDRKPLVEESSAIQNQGIDMDSEDSASFCDIVFGNKCTK